MDNLIIVGVCEWCKTRTRVHEIISEETDGIRVKLVCTTCLKNEDKSIRETIKRRMKNDNGERFSEEEIIKMVHDIIEGD